MNKNLPYSFSVPSSWYDGVYHDKAGEMKASRSFTLLHKEKRDNAVLLIHGYTGYPGELVRPAEDLYEKGFDVFVPRLPGHGTSGKDFMSSGKEDWVGTAEKALTELEKEYKSVSLVGHSMGGAIAAILLSRHSSVKKAVLCTPGIEIGFLDDKTVKALSFISRFARKIKKKWQSDSRYHLHYEDAPNDDDKLGAEYWKYTYPKTVLDLARIAKEAKEGLDKIESKVLVIGAEKDTLTVPSSVYSIASSIGENAKAVMIKDATHYVYYDISEKAEEDAVEATVSFLL